MESGTLNKQHPPVGVLAPWLQAIRDLRSAKQLWSGLGDLRRKIIIIPALVNADKNSEGPGIGEGEGRAVAYLPVLLRQALGNVHVEVRSVADLLKLNESGESFDTLLGDCDVILLGGQVNNPITEIAFQRLSLFPGDEWIADSCGTDSNGNWVKHRNSEDKRYSQYQINISNGSSEIVEDTGVFLIRKNCFSVDPKTNARIILCYGAHTFGTEAAVNALFNFQVAAEIVRRHNSIWNHAVDGEVSVRSSTDSDSLVGMNRIVSILSPPLLKGIQFQNPLLGSTFPPSVFNIGMGYVFEQIINFAAFFLGFALIAFGLWWKSSIFTLVGGFSSVVLGVIVVSVMQGLKDSTICSEIFKKIPKIGIILLVSSIVTLGITLYQFPEPAINSTQYLLLQQVPAIIIIFLFAGFGSLLEGQIIRGVYLRTLSRCQSQSMEKSNALGEIIFKQSPFFNGLSSVLEIIPPQDSPTDFKTLSASTSNSALANLISDTHNIRQDINCLTRDIKNAMNKIDTQSGRNLTK